MINFPTRASRCIPKNAKSAREDNLKSNLIQIIWDVIVVQNYVIVVVVLFK